MNNELNTAAATDNTESSTEMVTPPPTRSRRGFASMDPEKVKAISAMGGKAAHAAGTAHRFTHDEAMAAGAKGGSAPRVSRGRSAPKAK